MNTSAASLKAADPFVYDSGVKTPKGLKKELTGSQAAKAGYGWRARILW